jgi:hypothetical protein|tara:strand:+ start:150 stop:446 length:297 start_codon:yes stop_codon:yes gene_type:complete
MVLGVIPFVVVIASLMAGVQHVIGIRRIVLGALILTPVPAIICGHIARQQIRHRQIQYAVGPGRGYGMAQAGLILGYLVTVPAAGFVVFMLITGNSIS